jgi:hypothetical protein
MSQRSIRAAAVAAFVRTLLAGAPGAGLTQTPPDEKLPGAEQGPRKDDFSAAKDGLSIHQPGAFQGYTLVAPMNSTSTYLIDMEGRIVREWKSDYTPALSAYLLENGHLLRPAVQRAGGFSGPGAGGRIQEFNWEGELVWDFLWSSESIRPHHDICRLPSGPSPRGAGRTRSITSSCPTRSSRSSRPARPPERWCGNGTRGIT